MTVLDHAWEPTSPYVPSGHHVFRVAMTALHKGFRVVPPRGGVNPTGHLCLGPKSINLYTGT
jgi:hypothetical protein